MDPYGTAGACRFIDRCHQLVLDDAVRRRGVSQVAADDGVDERPLLFSTAGQRPVLKHTKTRHRPNGDRSHCFSVRSCDTERHTDEQIGHANLLVHPVTMDPDLREWDILTRDSPLTRQSKQARDGVENIAVVRSEDAWTMIYSDGLARQHLAWGQSPNLVHWKRQGVIDLSSQSWMSVKYSAPCIWQERDIWFMLLMGQDKNGPTALGMLLSSDLIHWTP